MIYEYFTSSMALLVLVTAMIKIIRFRAKTGNQPLAIGKDKKGIFKIWEIGSTAFLPFLLLFVGLFPFCAELPLTHPLLQSAGALFSFGGYLLLLYAFYSMGRSWRIGIDTQTQDQLVTTEFFAFSRNPIFLAFDVSFLGYFLTYPTPFMFFAMLGVWLGIHFQILSEEKFLKTKYGQSYKNYTQKTGRYLTAFGLKI